MYKHWDMDGEVDRSSILYVAANMKPKTAIEIAFSTQMSSLKALEGSIQRSSWVQRCTYREMPFAYYGVVPIQNNVGLAWFMTTTFTEAKSVGFAKACKRYYYPELIRQTPLSTLGNMVWDDYTEAKGLLKLLGFKETETKITLQGNKFVWMEWRR